MSEYKYKQTTWIGGKTIGTADVMNNIEDGIAKAHEGLEGVNAQLNYKVNKGDLGYINVKDFGAKGDGVADDREAIQNALDFAVSQGGGDVIFPHGTYIIGSTNSEFANHGLVINGVRIGMIGHGVVTIKATASMDDLIHIPDKASYLHMENLTVNGNKIAKCCLRGINNYNPYMILRKCMFQNGTEVNVNLSTYVALIERCIFNHGKTGIVIEPVGDSICTSITINSCYVNNMSGEYGYWLKNCVYTTMNSCACDNITNGVGYKFTHARGFAMNGCGAEKVKKPIHVGTFRGFTLNGFYGLNDGGEDVEYLIEFGGGKDATISGIYFQDSPAKYVLGLTNSSYGYENITVTDGCIKKKDIYYITNWYYATDPIKLIRDEETNRTLTINCTLDDLQNQLNNLPRIIRHTVTINITGGSHADTIQLKNRHGYGRIILNLGGYSISPTTASTYGMVIENVNVNMLIKNGSICQTKTHNYGEAVRVINSGFLAFDGVTFKNTSEGKGGACVGCHSNSIISVNNCTSSGTFESDGVFQKFDNDGTCITNGTL